MKGKFRFPNSIIRGELSYTAKRLAATLYTRANRFGALRCSVQTLARLSGLSVPTVRKNIQELKSAGYVTVERCYTYDGDLRRMVYARSIYTVTRPEQDYTLLPASVLGRELPPAAFCVFAFVLFYAGNSGRSWPSIRRIGAALRMAVSTVCRILQLLRKLPELLIWRCKRRSGVFCSNSYRSVSAPQNAMAGLQTTFTEVCESASLSLPAKKRSTVPALRELLGKLSFLGMGVLRFFSNIGRT